MKARFKFLAVSGKLSFLLYFAIGCVIPGNLAAQLNFDMKKAAELLKQARSSHVRSLDDVSDEPNEAINLSQWISLSSEVDQIDAGNLRLTSQQMAFQSFFGPQRGVNQLLFQASSYEYFREPTRALAVLANLNPRTLTKTQSILWYQLHLRSLINSRDRPAARELLTTLMKERPEILLTWSGYQDAVHLLAEADPNEQLDFFVKIINMHPNRRILKDSYLRMIAADHSKYSFNYLFLRRLALGRDMVDGLQEWLAEVFEKGQIERYRQHDVEYLRLLLLMRIDELARAEKVARKLLVKHAENRPRRLEYSQTLGQILERLNRGGEAFSLYSDLLDRYGRNRETRFIWENYARLLGQSSSFGDAAREYGGLVRIDARRHIRWYQFWFLYRAGRFEDALALIERNRRAQDYSRDEREPLGIFYWQARIYEKTGREAEALELYRRILSDDGASFYTTLIVGQPEEKGTQSRLALRSELAKSSAASRQEGMPGEKLNLAALPAVSYEDWRLARSKNRSQRVNINDFSRLISSQIDNRAHWMQAYPLLDFEWKQKVSEFFDMDPFILASVIRAESFYNPSAVSPVGAQGLMQIMPYTALKISYELNDSQFNFNELRNPQLSVLYGAYYMRKLLDYFGNNLVLALASYNAGPFKTLEWIEACGMCDADEFVESITFQETRRYVKSIVAHYAHYRRIYQQEISPDMATRLPSEFVRGAIIY